MTQTSTSSEPTHSEGPPPVVSPTDSVASDASPAIADSQDPIDPIALARAYVTGRSLRRGQTIQMVRELLAVIDAAVSAAGAATPVPRVAIVPDTALPTAVDVSAQVELGELATTAPRLGPCAAGAVNAPIPVVIRAPIRVQITDTRAIYLGPDANRHYTREEALGLARKIMEALDELRT